jgi:hypothetical protein
MSQYPTLLFYTKRTSPKAVVNTMEPSNNLIQQPIDSTPTNNSDQPNNSGSLQDPLSNSGPLQDPLKEAYHQRACTIADQMIRRWEKYREQFDDTYGQGYYDELHKFRQPAIPDEWQSDHEQDPYEHDGTTVAVAEERHHQLFYNNKFFKYNST